MFLGFQWLDTLHHEYKAGWGKKEGRSQSKDSKPADNNDIYEIFLAPRKA